MDGALIRIGHSNFLNVRLIDEGQFAAGRLLHVLGILAVVHLGSSQNVGSDKRQGHRGHSQLDRVSKFQFPHAVESKEVVRFGNLFYFMHTV